MSESLEMQFRLLRAQIESRLVPPSVIVVTSACAGDGKSATAFGLAESLADANYRTAVINAGDEPRRAEHGSARVIENAHPGSGGRLNVSLRARRNGLDEILLPTSASYFSRDTVELIVHELRGSYDYAIVDTTRFLQSDVALLFAAAATGVVIATRLGRPGLPDDQRMMNALRAVDATMIGVVAVAENTITNFYKTEDSRAATLPAPSTSQLRLPRSVPRPASGVGG